MLVHRPVFVCATAAACCPHGFRGHNRELAAVRRQLDDLREAKDEEAGRWEFEKNKLKTDLDIAIKKSKVI